MPSTLITKYGSGAPLASDLVRGELAVDTENGRLYTEDSLGAVVEIGLNPAADVTFADNVKAIFGAGSDLQIYHDGTSNIFAGDIVIDGSDASASIASPAALSLKAGDANNEYSTLRLATSADGTLAMIGAKATTTGAYPNSVGQLELAVQNGASTNTVLTVTSTGIDVTGGITTTSSVGIRTTSPLAPLDVKSAEGNAGFHYGTSSSPERGNLWYDTDGSGWKFNIGKVQSSLFTPQITIQDNGNVGIGFDTPIAPLHVQVGGSGEIARFRDNALDAVVDVSIVNDSQTWALRVDGASSDSFHIRNAQNSTNPFTIDTSGNVGIGESSPSEKISIAKGISYNTDSALFTTIGVNDGAVNNNAVYRWRTGITGSATGHSYTFSTLARAEGSYTERMRIDSSGNLLVGTTSNAISGQNNSIQSSAIVSTSGPLISHTSSVGVFEFNTNKVAIRAYGATAGTGHISFNVGGGGGSADFEAVRIDASGDMNIVNSGLASLNFTTDGSTDYARITGGKSGSGIGELQFWTYSSGISRAATIDQSGNLLVGGSSTLTGARIESFGSANGVAGIGMRHTGATAGQWWRIYMQNDSKAIFTNAAGTGVSLTYGATAWAAVSDEALKENISDIGPVLDKVTNYRCVNYSLKATQSADADKIGFIAQDWEADFPNVVDRDENDELSMKYTETIPVLLKAIQEQQDLIESLTARIAALEGAN